MRIAIGSDRVGLDLKKSVTVSLMQEHHEVIDVGIDGAESNEDARYADAVAEALREYRADRGIIVCGSGVGASMAANRIPGIRAGLCHDTYSAHEGVEHDDMNVLVLGGRVVGVELATELIHAFLNARFRGQTRPARRAASRLAGESMAHALRAFGQSVWLDYLRRSLIGSGELRRMIDEDAVSGVVSSPALLEKAIVGAWEYGDVLGTLEARTLNTKALYEHLIIRDVRAAADALRPVYRTTARRDGYVSIDLAPALAHDAAGTTAEAQRLVAAIDRRNVMIRIPATAQGIAAMRTLVGEGISVNATLLFAQDAYEETVEAYLDGLEEFAGRGGDLARIASVASVFVSRIDTAVDEQIDLALDRSRSADAQRVLRALHGKAAIATAKVIYQRYHDLFSGPRWEALASHGAHTQRVLWTSTGTKNPAYRDVLYVEELIGPDTVISIPAATFDAFRDHGRPRASLTEDVDAAEDTLRMLAEAGVSLKSVTDELLADGLRVASDAFDRLLETVDQSRRERPAVRLNRLTFALPAPITRAVERSLLEWSAEGKVRRLWAGDASLWTGKDEAQCLGWLGIASGRLAHLRRLTCLRDRARSDGFSDVVVLGMGASSLVPDVMKRTFGHIDGFPELHVLDSTDPAELKTLERRIDLRHTLFVVACRSGATVEPHILKQYFFDRMVTLLGRPDAGRRFIAITDPGSPMQPVAERDHFRHVFLGWPTVPGHYSALSDFGLVPAALMGIDVGRLLDRTEAMVCACMPPVPVLENPGVVAGTILGMSARHGRDKLTIVASPGLLGFAAWLEQLIAESTGKDGKGLVPIDREAIGPPAVYGRDRLFVYLRLASEADSKQGEAIDALEHAGHAVVRVLVEHPYDLGREFFRWQVAAAVAGSILEINPFAQPDLEAGRSATRRLVAEYEKSGQLAAEAPLFVENGVSIFAHAAHAAALTRAVSGRPTLAAYLKAHLNRVRPGDYVALLAFVHKTEESDRILQAVRHAVRNATHAATCLAYGPRYVYSIGQAFTGGPNSGVFLQITCDDAEDVPVPGRRSTFGIVNAAEARGEFRALAGRDRRLMRLHLAGDLGTALRTIQAAVKTALS